MLYNSLVVFCHSERSEESEFQPLRCFASLSMTNTPIVHPTFKTTTNIMLLIVLLNK